MNIVSTKQVNDKVKQARQASQQMNDLIQKLIINKHAPQLTAKYLQDL